MIESPLSGVIYKICSISSLPISLFNVCATEYRANESQLPFNLFNKHSLMANFVCFLEAEHGYASTMPIPDDMRTSSKRSKTKKSQGSRLVIVRCLSPWSLLLQIFKWNDLSRTWVCLGLMNNHVYGYRLVTFSTVFSTSAFYYLSAFIILQIFTNHKFLRNVNHLKP